jgi:acyl dehydratase
MMAARELTRAPRMLPLYLRAAAALLPGASHLPGLPGGGGEIPELELTLRDVEVEPDRLTAYARVCGFAAEKTLPATYPHVLAFPLHMALMADGRFPFAAVGLVHLENEITQQRPLPSNDRLSFSVRATTPKPHPRGRTFGIVTKARVDEELVWEERSTMLRRGGQGSNRSAATDHEQPEPPDHGPPEVSDHGPPTGGVQWRIAGDIGRRYGAVSGDRNPIHMHALGARVFGFPQAIAHGMWTKAHCLAELQKQLPDAFTVVVRFRKPVPLPATVSFRSDRDSDAIRFALRSATGDALHLYGHVEPPTPKTAPGRER